MARTKEYWNDDHDRERTITQKTSDPKNTANIPNNSEEYVSFYINDDHDRTIDPNRFKPTSEVKNLGAQVITAKLENLKI